jgi:hypothetical protein
VYYNGGNWNTWVSSHSLKIAIEGTISDPATFIAALFTNCHKVTALTGPGGLRNCSSDLTGVGVIVAEGILIGSVVIGTVMAARTARPSEMSQ